MKSTRTTVPSPPASLPPWTESFDTADALTSAQVAGRVSIDAAEPFKGGASLKLARDKADMDVQVTSFVTEAFPVARGRWSLSVATRAALHSPDSSYCGTVRFEALDASGAVVTRIELAVATGHDAWRLHRKTVETMADVVAGRFVIRLEKTYGEFHVDELAAAYLGPSLRTVSAIKYATKAVGNLFFPGDPLRLTPLAKA